MRFNKLFYSKKEIFLFLFLVLFIYALNLAYQYHKFEEFKETKFIEATVEHSYLKTKNERTYRVLKLKTSHFSFYTTTKKESVIARYDRLSLGIRTDKVSFKDYIKKSFYMPSFKIKKLEKKPKFKDKIINFIENQHDNPKIKELYATLYLATPISKELRNDVTKWGIAHVVSISGFHLSIIFATFFLLITPIYRFFQSRFFPYRSSYFDISVVAFLAMIGYLFLLDFAPSFLRSLLMGLLGFLFLSKNLRILSFWTLFLTIILSVAIFPNLVFSIGFYFSCLGVFYIYLYMHHFKFEFGSRASNFALNVVVFNIYVYFAMNIPVYHFFDTLAFSQIAVIPIGYIFTIFYPVSAFLHLIGQGGLMDEWLLAFLNYEVTTYKTTIPPMLFYTMNSLLIPAIKFRSIAILLALMGVLPLFFI
ncbi:MAG: ComEC/Rec2 family competence protein [Campylobacteraceae bacterium]|nr:ComEC/Rec2 family competence protein [Campylobacteraceae bacterium]